MPRQILSPDERIHLVRLISDRFDTQEKWKALLYTAGIDHFTSSRSFERTTIHTVLNFIQDLEEFGLLEDRETHIALGALLVGLLAGEWLIPLQEKLFCTSLIIRHRLIADASYNDFMRIRAGEEEKLADLFESGQVDRSKLQQIYTMLMPPRQSNFNKIYELGVTDMLSALAVRSIAPKPNQRLPLLICFEQLVSDQTTTTASLESTSQIHGEEEEIEIQPITLAGPIEYCWAVVVGVRKHVDPVYGELPHAANDAYGLGTVLLSGARGYHPERLGIFVSDTQRSSNTFEVKPAINTEVLKATQHFAKHAGENDLLLFYFSGHGVRSKDRLYLIFGNTEETIIEQSALDVAKIKSIIQNSQARVKIIILDTCHAGAISGLGKSVTNEIVDTEYMRLVFESASGLIIITSCQADERSFPLEDYNISVFTYYLLECLKDGREKQTYVTVDHIKRYIYQWVKDWSLRTKKPQTPGFTSEKLTGDPIFADWRTKEEDQKL